MWSQALEVEESHKRCPLEKRGKLTTIQPGEKVVAQTCGIKIRRTDPVWYQYWKQLYNCSVIEDKFQIETLKE